MIELGEQYTTLTRVKDNGIITWTNGQQHLPYKVVQAMEEERVWNLARYETGLIKDKEVVTQQKRIIDFKKKMKERIQREYVEGCKSIPKIGDFMGGPDTGEPNTWKKKDEAQ